MTPDLAPTGLSAVWQYRIAGLVVRSEFRLPLDDGAEGDADVQVIDEPVAVVRSEAGDDRRLVAEGDDHEIRLRWPGLASMAVEYGRRIGVAREMGVADEEVAPLVMGVGMGLVLHQRGRLVLHASAVALPSGAVAFVGVKGAGKSTMAGALAARGGAIVADDALPVDVAGEEIMAWPGPAALKLWPESAVAIGRSPRRLKRLHPRASKRVLPDVDTVKRPIPLRSVYVLEISDHTGVEPLRGQGALIELVRHSYAARFVPELGATPEHFERCATLARAVPLFRLSRPASLDRLSDVAELVEAHVTSLD